MPTNKNQYEDYQEWASTGGGEGDPVESATDIETYIDGLMASVGTLHASEATLPTTATERPNGSSFINHNDLVQYLEDGGLIVWDTSGNPTPNPIVNVVKRFSDLHQAPVYDVWIDEESG